MFRDMRRIKQLLPEESTREILDRGSYGTLACIGDEGYPYTVPVNYIYQNGIIYFHSGKAGHKIDAILKEPKVSFCVVDSEEIVSEEFTTYFRSAIVFGKARIAEGNEHLTAFTGLVEKFSQDQPEAEKQRQVQNCTRAYIIAIDAEHITGKEAIELVRVRDTQEF